ncbi:hypothetical protein NEHOM01_2384 [Nematocida homosporus]|uniref:uncharacterized protein n=1 Tax=Nematocida homosporus TaxID=1912981 RepID=UPI00221F896B|nr:uncharacterized protein NEHOM01_2384 [Nematocida homosporus]KAI5187808.1 hypothetical protein NEHOM01_2384 [Nematocida homosporus]
MGYTSDEAAGYTDKVVKDLTALMKASAAFFVTLITFVPKSYYNVYLHLKSLLIKSQAFDSQNLSPRLFVSWLTVLIYTGILVGVILYACIKRKSSTHPSKSTT